MTAGAPATAALRRQPRGQGRPAPPVRLLHLGLGGFFRAHQAWYTEHAADCENWGIAAFTGRSHTPLVDDLAAQEGLYTLVTRGAGGDGFETVGSLARAHPAEDHDAWLGYFRSPALAAVTLTVTEAGYGQGPDGQLDLDRAALHADVQALRRDQCAPVRTAPARLVAGLAARRGADAGPLALVPCDNLAGNGTVTRRVTSDLAEMVDAALAAWMADSVATVTTVVDRITPRTAAADLRTVRVATGLDDRCPVVAEPFAEWVLGGAFPAGRPRWEAAGATFTDDVTPFEQRKLWLLNGAHSLLAYAGLLRGHTTVAEAVADGTCRSWLEEWWGEASPHVGQATGAVSAYRGALVERFSNPRMEHHLAQIAEDGSQKLPVRVLPVLRAERSAGRLPYGATRILAAWICHLRGAAAISDVRAAEFVGLAAGALPDAVRRVLGAMDPAVGADGPVAGAVVDHCQRFERP